MSARVDSTNRVLTSERDARLAQGVLADLAGPQGAFRIDRDGEITDRIPAEVGRILQQVLDAMATGGTVTVSSTPEELTTSSAAAILGISRPTLLKMVTDGKIPAHRVGSHTRFHAEDVMVERSQRRARERAAFEALRELEGDEI